jgi:NADPH:quinone reductase-like Zn-dependent oxidoreductase
MEAAVIVRTGPADELTYADVETPQTGPYDIRVGDGGLDLTFPPVLGWDVAGTVAAVGQGVFRRCWSQPFVEGGEQAWAR